MSVTIKVDTKRNFRVTVSKEKLLKLIADDLKQNPLVYELSEVRELPDELSVDAEGRNDYGEPDHLYRVQHLELSWTESS
jgi:hypothetical protein